ncbi:MAG TPA: DUF4019 domain-containing protein [Terriglobia bacterium]|nr:DUF4019 domain-containing protein [Terriglobia bacterium]
MNSFIRLALGATLLWASLPGCGAARAAQAQGSPNAAAQRATEQWLALVDAGKYGESWDEAAQILKNTSSRKDWIAYLKDKREHLGKVASRKLLKADALKNVPGLPPGQFVGMQYRTSFDKLKNGVEVVIPVLDQDGKWRVSEYVVQPAQGQ